MLIVDFNKIAYWVQGYPEFKVSIYLPFIL